MSFSWALVIVLAVAVPRAYAFDPSPAAKKVDLSGQFPDAACRDQGALGACHSFAATGLLEAAVFRRHGAAGADGGRLRLSEADLFVLKISAGWYYSNLRTYLDQGLSVPEAFTAAEGGTLKTDLTLALRDGVCSEDVAPWKLVTQRYEELRARREKAMQGKLSAAGFPTDRGPGDIGRRLRDAPDVIEIARRMEADAAAGLAALSADQSRGYSDSLSGIRAASLQLAQSRSRQAESGAHAALSFADFIKEASAVNSRQTSEILLGDDPRIGRERERVRGLFQGFTGDVAPFARSSGLLSGPNCFKSGAPQREKILSWLERGIPAGVSMDLTGLSAWGQGGALKPVGHAFVISGYERGPAGYVFKTRNSWGGKNPAVSEDQLCRVVAVAAVLTPNEKDPVAMRR